MLFILKQGFILLQAINSKPYNHHKRGIIYFTRDISKDSIMSPVQSGWAVDNVIDGYYRHAINTCVKGMRE